MNSIKSILFFLFITSTANAQIKEFGRALNPGDTVPDSSFIVREDGVSVQKYFHDYKGKLVILDFWGVNCLNCVEDMPRLLKLQEEFSNQIQIILVTEDNERDVKQLWVKLSKFIPVKLIDAAKMLPCITSDTIFKTLFPHRFLSVHIWIDSSRVYRAFVLHNSTTPANIEAFLNNSEVKFTNYREPQVNYSQLKAKLDNNLGVEKNFLFGSFFTGYDSSCVSTFHEMVVKDSITNKITELAYFNESRADLYTELYKHICFNMASDTIFPEPNPLFEINGTPKYINPDMLASDSDIGLKRNYFCYMVKIMPKNTTDIIHLMQENLDDFFSLNSAFEEREIKCLVLRRVSIDRPIQSNGGEPSMTISVEGNKRKVIIKSESMMNIFQLLYHDYVYSQRLQVAFIDETEFKGNADLILPWGGYGSPYSIEDLNKSLNRFNLSLTWESRKMKILVVKSKGSI